MWKTLLKFILAGILIALLALFGEQLGRQIPQAEVWLKAQGAWAPFFFTLAVCILPMFFFSTDVLCFSAGLLFGMGFGFALAASGLVGSALLMFVVSRYLARKKIEKLLHRYPKFKTVNRAIRKGGFRIAFLLRVAPVPFAPLSYFFGISNLGFRDYFFSIFGTMGTVFVAAYYGNMATHVTKLAGKTATFSPLQDSLRIAGLVLCLAVLVAITHYAREAIRAVTQEDNSL